MKRDGIDRLSHYEGCFVGLACGDALGTTLEFEEPGSFEPIDDMVGGGPFGLKPGQWTDDTSMALCLAASLLLKKGFDPADQLRVYVTWWKHGEFSSTGRCFDIGNTVRSALIEYQNTGDPYCGQMDERSAGNGSIMRLAPVAMAYANNPMIGIEKCGDSSRTTHGVLDCVDACRYFGGLIIGALNGETKEQLLSSKYSPVDDQWIETPLSENINTIALGSFKNKQPPEIKGTGYVVKSLEAALWAFYNSKGFEDGALMAANLGGDADTTAAIYGQLAGAYYGLGGIPVRWVNKIYKLTTIKMYAESLCDLSLSGEFCYE